MNYYIEKHDMEIILDALEHFAEYLKNDDHAPTIDRFPYSIEDVDGLFQSFDNSFVEK